MPVHVPSEEVLLDYATGALGEAPSLMVATHLALCPESRSQVKALEAVGGALLETIEPDALATDSLDAVLDRLDEAGPPLTAHVPARTNGPSLPQPLRDYLGTDLDGVQWQRRGMGISTAALPGPIDDGHTFLLKVDAGRAMPQHTHEGNEWVMVLTGAFDDESGHYARGDIAMSDSSVEHQPVAAPGEDCVCLVVIDGPLRLTGPVGRFMNRFVKI